MSDFDQHKNFAYSTIATAPSPATTGTSLIVQTGDGTKFPTPPFNAVVWPASNQPTTANAEIVRVTGIATDTFTIVRQSESTSARSIGTGDQIANIGTLKTMLDIELATRYMDKTPVGIDIVLPSGSDYMVLDSHEVKSTQSFEVPADSTFEVYSPALQPKNLTNPYCFSAYKNSGTQSVTAGTVTKITFDVEEFDFNNNYATDTYTVPVSGIYLFIAGLGYNAAASNTRTMASIFRNGVVLVRGDDRFTNAITGNAVVMHIGFFNKGDTVDIRCDAVAANATINAGISPKNTYFQGTLLNAL